MPYNPSLSAYIAGYVSPDLLRRMERIRRAKPRWTRSKQIERCLELGLQHIERDAGLKPKSE